MKDIVRNNNDMFLRTRPSHDVEVTVVINVSSNLSERDILLNAAEALEFKANNGAWKTWCSRYKIKFRQVFN